MKNTNTTVFLVTCSCDDGASSPFFSAWVCATEKQALATVMDEISNWAQGDLEYYESKSDFKLFKAAWKNKNLEKLVAAWNEMSSMNIEINKQVVYTEESVELPEFPWS